MSGGRRFGSGLGLWTGSPRKYCVTFTLCLFLSLQSLLELEVDLDNLELEDIDTTDINLDEDILDD